MWQLKFNIAKCTLLHLILKSDTVKDLGIMDTDLKLCSNINSGS